MTSQEMLAYARRIMERARASAAWPVETAILARRALEAAIDGYWSRHEPEIARCSARAQLLCLAPLLGDEVTAERATYLWSALSRAMHHSAYDLGPTREELTDWLAQVETVAQRLEAA